MANLIEELHFKFYSILTNLNDSHMCPVGPHWRAQLEKQSCSHCEMASAYHPSPQLWPLRIVITSDCSLGWAALPTLGGPLHDSV